MFYSLNEFNDKGWERNNKNLKAITWAYEFHIQISSDENLPSQKAFKLE